MTPEDIRLQAALTDFHWAETNLRDMKESLERYQNRLEKAQERYESSKQRLEEAKKAALGGE